MKRGYRYHDKVKLRIIGLFKGNITYLRTGFYFINDQFF